MSSIGSERHEAGRRGARGRRGRRATLAAALALAGCGGGAASGPGAPGAVANAGDGEPAALALDGEAPGDAGLPRLAWGMTPAEVVAALPGAVVADGAAEPSVEVVMTLAGERCEVSLGFEGGALARIDGGCAALLPSIHACGELLGRARAALEPRLGPGGEEPFVATWRLPAAELTVGCDVAQDDRARLALRSQPAPAP